LQTNFEDPLENSTSKSDSVDEGSPCVGLSRDQWIDKGVSLLSPDGVAVATDIVRASQPQDYVDSSPLGESDVGIYILESNGHPCVPEDVIYNEVGLFFQLQKYNCLNSDRNMTRMCLR
jgi:hypothetical protein